VGVKLILMANWLHSLFLHCWLGYLACKSRPRSNYDVSSGTLSHYSLTLCRLGMKNSFFSALIRLYVTAFKRKYVICILDDLYLVLISCSIWLQW